MRNSLCVALFVIMAAPALAQDADWTQLFDGKSLDAWTIKGGSAKYSVEDGMLVGTTVEGSPNTFLCKGPFADFELQFDVLCDRELNSGVQIRSHAYEQDTPQPSNPKRIRKAGEVYGYQCEIAESSKGVSGNFWDEGRHTKWWDDFATKPAAQKAFKDGEWNHYRIVAQGDQIRSWVNGVACADFRDQTDASGFIGLQVHGIKSGTGPYKVRWKNVRLKVLKPERQAARPANQPNVVVILSDDFGWGSLGCYGAPDSLKTPHLDRLAREGRRFTHAYAPGSVCSPTRYGLMTGRYYWRTSIKDGEVLPGNAPLHIETSRLTLASLLKSQGYRTAAFGKWHLGMGSESRRTDWSGTLSPGPLDIGFDYFFGLGSNPWSGPHTFIENRRVLGAIPGQSVVVSGNREGATTSGIEQPWKESEIMQSLTEKVVGWLEQQQPQQPFFLYFAPNAIHRPVAPNAKFTGSKFGIYGDFIHELDASVGEILAALDRGKLADQTLVIFTSDNGGVANERMQDEISAARDKGLLVNGPLRGGKHDVWEGGFREPFLARWPGKIPAGTVSDQVICHTDLVATVASILQVPLPTGAAEDSFDIGRALTEATPGPPVRDHVILQSADATYAIRMGNWKLIERVDVPPFEHRNRAKAQQAARKAATAPKHDELYNLASDGSESKDLSAANAEHMAEMKKRLRDARGKGFTRSDQ